MKLFTNIHPETGEPLLTARQMQWIICDTCRGNGKHDHPAFSNGITSEEFAEWDEDEREGYLEGRYDVRCDDCSGSGKQQVPAPGLPFAIRRILADMRKTERELYRDEASERRLRAAENGYMEW